VHPIIIIIINVVSLTHTPHPPSFPLLPLSLSCNTQTANSNQINNTPTSCSTQEKRQPTIQLAILCKAFITRSGLLTYVDISRADSSESLSKDTLEAHHNYTIQHHGLTGTESRGFNQTITSCRTEQFRTATTHATTALLNGVGGGFDRGRVPTTGAYDKGANSCTMYKETSQ
jgi:hypothetical protein